MTFSNLQQLIKADLFRYEGKTGFSHLCRLSIREPGFRITLLMRLCAFTRCHSWSRYGVYHFCRILHHLNSVRYGVHINFVTPIGPGLYIPHACSIVVNRHCQLGANCHIGQNVTLGASNHGKNKGCPTIKDNVFIATGAVVYGQITIGSHSAVGANSVVNKDVPAKVVVAGSPAKIISKNGSDGYNNNLLTQS